MYVCMYVYIYTYIYNMQGISDPRGPPEHRNRVMAEPWRGHVAYGFFSNVMVPVADMLNHDNDDESNIAWLHTSSSSTPPASTQPKMHHRFAIIAGKVPLCVCVWRFWDQGCLLQVRGSFWCLGFRV